MQTNNDAFKQPPCCKAGGVDSNQCPIGRAYLCELCYARATICPKCDRGQIYCSIACSQKARRSRQREAGRRYQVSDRGRFLHAERSRRYRAACRAVTHQGLPQEALARGSVPASLAIIDTRISALRNRAQPAVSCYYCGSPVSQFVRIGFLRRYTNGRKARIKRKKTTWHAGPP